MINSQNSCGENKNINRNEYLCINGMKGVAALIVLLYHYGHFSTFMTGGYPYDKWLKPIYVYGHYCVDLFFLISGFLFVSFSIMNMGKGQNLAEIFIKKKVIKLFPLFWGTTFVVAILQWGLLLLSGRTFCHSADLYSLILNIFGFQHVGLGDDLAFNGPAWYLSVLMICYVIYIYIYKVGKINTFLPYMVLVIGLALYRVNISIPFLQRQIARGLISFSVGVIIAKFFSLYSFGKASKFFLRVHITSFLVMLISGIISFVFNKKGIDIWGEKHLCFILILIPMFFIFCVSSPIIRKLFSLKPVLYMGKLSYSLYLWQFPVELAMVIVGLFVNIDFCNSVVWWLRLAISYVIALISNKLLEPKLFLIVQKAVEAHNVRMKDIQS